MELSPGPLFGLLRRCLLELRSFFALLLEALDLDEEEAFDFRLAFDRDLLFFFERDLLFFLERDLLFFFFFERDLLLFECERLFRLERD